MISVTLKNTNGYVTVGANSFYTSITSNKLFLNFENDGMAREVEAILKKNNFLTSHSESSVAIHNGADIELIIK